MNEVGVNEVVGVGHTDYNLNGAKLVNKQENLKTRNRKSRNNQIIEELLKRI